MRSVLKDGDSGGGSATVAIAVVAVLSSGVLLFSIFLLCWPDIHCETDLSTYVYSAKSYVLYFVVIHLPFNICMSLCQWPQGSNCPLRLVALFL